MNINTNLNHWKSVLTNAGLDFKEPENEKSIKVTFDTRDAEGHHYLDLTIIEKSDTTCYASLIGCGIHKMGIDPQVGINSFLVEKSIYIDSPRYS